jgi:hypothetical protein
MRPISRAPMRQHLPAALPWSPAAARDIIFCARAPPLPSFSPCLLASPTRRTTSRPAPSDRARQEPTPFPLPFPYPRRQQLRARTEAAKQPRTPARCPDRTHRAPRASALPRSPRDRSSCVLMDLHCISFSPHNYSLH